MHKSVSFLPTSHFNTLLAHTHIPILVSPQNPSPHPQALTTAPLPELFPFTRGFPKEARIKPGAVKFQGFLVFSNHTKAETTIARNFLETGNLPGGYPRVRFDETVKLQLLRTPEELPPRASLSKRYFQGFSL